MPIVKIKKVKNQGWGSNQVKAYEGTMTKVGVGIDRNGNQHTGLTPEDEARLEPLLGQDKGGLRRGHIERNPNPFWTDYTIIFEGNTPLVLDTDNPEHELAYLVLKAQNKVAKTQAEAKHPRALFVIFDEESEAERDNKRGKIKRTAVKLFDELTPTDMRNILKLYGRESDSSSSAVVENQLGKLMEDDAATFLAYANDPALKSKVFILNLVSAGILKRKGGAFIEFATDEVLAYDMDSMVKFVEDKKNQGKVLQFKEAIK